MTFNLTAPFAADVAAKREDTRLLKILLNRLGYYLPDEAIGISEFPDRQIFTALRQFQKDNALPVTGKAKPDDETVKALNHALEKSEQSKGSYIWRTMRDLKVRPHHRVREGKIFSWDKPPWDGHPGKAPKCRCWAQKTHETNYDENRQKPLPKPEGIPDHWIEKPAGKREGTIYINPDNPNDRVRVMHGNPDSPYPWQQKPYVIDQNGSFYDINGKPIPGIEPGKTPEAHIPYEDYNFRR